MNSARAWFGCFEDPADLGAAVRLGSGPFSKGFQRVVEHSQSKRVDSNGSSGMTSNLEVTL
jgi:hypothetical protein